MIDPNFILLVFLLLLNIMLMLIRIPLIGIVVSIFTEAIAALHFLNLEATVIPANPYTTGLLVVIAAICLVANAWELK